MKMRIKLYRHQSSEDKKWTLCILTVNGVEHATGDLRTYSYEKDEICVGTSTTGISGNGTIKAKSLYKDFDLEHFVCLDVEAEVVDNHKSGYITLFTFKHPDITI